MKIRSIKKWIAGLLVITMTSQALPLYVFANTKSMERITQSDANIQYDEVTPTTILGNFVDSLAVHIDTMNELIEKDDLKAFKKYSKDLKKEISNVRISIENELKENAVILDELNTSNAKQIHNEFKAELELKLNELDALLTKLDEQCAITKDLNGQNGESLRNIFEDMESVLTPEMPQQALGSLPHQNVDITTREPVTDIGISPSYSTGVQAISRGITLTSAPVAQDLAETPETKLSQEIKDLTKSFKSPVEIYEYVRNNVDFEPYYGSRKGATGAFNQMSGNDFDQASLLIAMFRYSDIPSRYVKGTVEVPIASALSWTGAKTAESAVKLLASLGIPTIAVTSGGKIVAARLEHIWVEAYIPYENYRGAGEMTGDKIWIPLDPSFKQYSIEKGLDIKEIVGVTDEQILEALKSDADRYSDGAILNNINYDKMNSFIDDATEKVEAYIKDNNLEDTNAKQLMSGKKIIPENLGLLPNTLPYKTVTVLSETNVIPDSSSEKIGFSIRGNEPFNLNFSGSKEFNVQFNAIDLYGKKITLSWTPASQEDITIINYYGGLFKTPAYLVQLKPQVKVDGKVVAEGKAAGFGNNQEFTISMGHVSMPVENITNPVTVGGFYGISFDYGKIDIQELDSIKEKILAIQNTATEDSIYTDEVMGEILNSIGKVYFGQLDAMNDIIAESYGVSSTRLVSEAMTGYSPRVKYMFSRPVEVTGGSFYIDVDHDVVSVTSLDGSRENEIGYMLNTGVIASSMEHGVLEQIFQLPSVSAIKILTEAGDRGVPIYTIGKDNIDKLNEITASKAVKDDIRNAVNRGNIVTIPQTEINYYGWQGSGYIVMDMETGSAGYMISGGQAGGAIAFDFAVSLIGLITLTMAIYDVIMIVTALMAATNPIMCLIFSALYILSVVNVIMTLHTIYMYWETGQKKYAYELMGQLLLDVAFMGLFKLVEYLIPGAMSLFHSVKNQMGEFLELAAKYSDEFAEAIARRGSDLINMVKTYGDDMFRWFGEFGDDALTFFRNFSDDASRLLDKYGGAAIRTLKGYGDDLVRFFRSFGDEAIDVAIEYGDDAMRAMDNVIDPDLINTLDDLGIKPNWFEKYGIDSLDDATNMLLKQNNAAHTIKSLESLTSFTDNLSNILDGFAISPSRFNELKLLSAEQITDPIEREIMKAIRDSIPAPTPNTLLQKAIPYDDIANYIDGTYNQLGGFVSKAEDVKMLKNYDDLYNGLRLDYPGNNPYNPISDESMGVIRFYTDYVDDLQAPPYSSAMGGTTSYPYPFTGNGFLSSTNGVAIPEYEFINRVGITDGAELYEVTKDGYEILRAVYDGTLQKFVNILD